MASVASIEVVMRPCKKCGASSPEMEIRRRERRRACPEEGGGGGAGDVGIEDVA